MSGGPERAARVSRTEAIAASANAVTSVAQRSARVLEWLGNAAAISLLIAMAVAFVPLHDDAWWSAMPQPSSWWLALGCVVAYTGFCTAIGVRSLRGRQRDGALPTIDTVLVAYASQTGFAQAMAERTADALVSAGVAAQCRDLGRIDVATLAATSRALFVVSTTGEGDPPDHAMAFVRDAMAAIIALPGLGYAVLALGDREYAHFCGFGHRLDAWLRHSGARALFDIVDVDNGDAGALRHWQHHLGRLADAPDLPDWAPAVFDDWTLTERCEANPGSVGDAAFYIALTPQPLQGSVPLSATWQAGDIAEIGPRHASADVADALEALCLDGAARVVVDGRSTTLAELLSRSHLPDPRAPKAHVADSIAPLPSAPGSQAPRVTIATPLLPMPGCADAQAVADTLVPLPHREYSIASLPGDGALELLVRRMRRPDGRVGIGSGWLCDGAVLGGTIALRIRHNANFQPPACAKPMILIGNGTGIAGLRAHLKYRAAADARGAWLLFGERSAQYDAFYADDIAGWLADGTLSRVDRVYSRDQPERRYVQHALRDAGDTLYQWVAAGAAIYVCGSLDGMAPAVDVTLREALGDVLVDTMLADGRYRRDVY